MCSKIEANCRHGVFDCARLLSVSKTLTGDFLFGEANLFSFYISWCMLVASCRFLRFYEQQTAIYLLHGIHQRKVTASFRSFGVADEISFFIFIYWNESVCILVEVGKMQAPGVIRFDCIALAYAHSERSRLIYRCFFFSSLSHNNHKSFTESDGQKWN